MKRGNCTNAWRGCERNWPAGIIWNGWSGDSAAMQRVRAQVELAAAGSGTVLMVGPAGQRPTARGAEPSISPSNRRWERLHLVACSTLPAEVLRSTIASLITRHSQPENNARVTLLLSDVHLLPAEVQPDVVRWLAALPKNIRFMATADGAIGIARRERRVPARTGALRSARW